MAMSCFKVHLRSSTELKEGQISRAVARCRNPVTNTGPYEAQAHANYQQKKGIPASASRLPIRRPTHRPQHQGDTLFPPKQGSDKVRRF